MKKFVFVALLGAMPLMAQTPAPAPTPAVPTPDSPAVNPDQKPDDAKGKKDKKDKKDKKTKKDKKSKEA